MLNRVAEGVFVHESEFCQSNAVVVQGRAGVLVIDAGVQEHEMACLADDLSQAGQSVVAGFSTHPHWDHLLWHARLGEAPRYGTARCAATVRERLSDPGAKARIAAHLIPAGIAGQVPLDLLGLITTLPTATALIPWDGPPVRIIEHQAHAPGHAALLIEEAGVLVAGDMLSDVLVPILDLNGAADPIEDYLAGLRLLEGVAGDVAVVVPGHGSVGAGDQVRARIEQDRAYVLAVREGRTPGDPRIGPSAKPGWEWVSDVHEGQARRLRLSIDDITDHVAELKGVLVLRPQPGDGTPEISWGDVFFSYAPDGPVPAAQPFATIVTKDYPDEPGSGLDRPGAFRLNISVSAADFHRIIGRTSKEASGEDYDASAVDTWFPHPVYGRAGWVSVVNPGLRTRETALGLVDAAHESARARSERRQPGPGDPRD
jgi:glyoxylase-like metal-dependent hydrolase (beta-lactamase superfamily II)